MPRIRRCAAPGCDNEPAGRRKTCSSACRSRLARYHKRQRSKNAKTPLLPTHLGVAADAVRKQVRDAAHEVMKEELRPVVREELTEDVLHGIGRLVQLTPRMVELIERDMESSDPVIAQRAYTLLAKYTLGNAAVAPAPAEQAQAGVTVHFNVPRPGDRITTTQGDVVTVEQPDETSTCSECGQTKPRADFVPDSDRCQACHDELHALVASRFGG